MVFWQSGARASLALPCSGDLGCVFPRISQSGYVGCRFPRVLQCLCNLGIIYARVSGGVAIWGPFKLELRCFAVSWQSGLQLASSVAISNAFC